jgi:hypothetical protein
MQLMVAVCGHSEAAGSSSSGAKAGSTAVQEPSSTTCSQLTGASHCNPSLQRLSLQPSSSP